MLSKRSVPRWRGGGSCADKSQANRRLDLRVDLNERLGHQERCDEDETGDSEDGER
jgi:hypothetical protein